MVGGGGCKGSKCMQQSDRMQNARNLIKCSKGKSEMKY